MTTAALDVEGVRREFGPKQFVAVDDVSFSVDPGRIVCLLGPNGAGKTTTVRMCTTLLTPTRGSITVDGVDAVRHPRRARQRVGLVLGGDRGFYERASGLDNLLFFADVAGVDSRARAGRVAAALAAVNLQDRAADPVRTYSRGMRQRLHIARSLLAEPRLLVLDEPTNGLDPEVAIQVRDLIRDLVASGVGVLLTTHYMAEAEQLSDELLLLIDGRIVQRGTAADIISRSGVAAVTTFSTGILPDEATACIRQLPGVKDVVAEVRDGVRQVRIAWHGNPDQAALVAVMEPSLGRAPDDLVTRRATLEESYLAYVQSAGVGS